MWPSSFYKLFFLFLFIIASLQKSCKDPGFTQSSSRVTYYKDDKPSESFKVHYFCKNGYKLFGSRVLTCRSNGTWSSRKPTCVRGISDGPSQSSERTSADYCEDPGIPTASIRFTYYNNTKFGFGSRVKFTCNEGYVLRGHEYITCEATGQWSNKTPKCEAAVKLQLPKHCPKPGALENGKIVSQEDQPDVYLVGSQVSYECDHKFILRGSPVLTCTSTESWDNPVPQCVREKMQGHRRGFCKLPEKPQHGSYTKTLESSMRAQGDYYPRGTQLTYKCTNRLYTLRQNRLNHETVQRVCLPTGEWSSTEPHCEIVCGRTKYVSSSSPFIVFGQVTGKGAWPWQAAISLKDHKNDANTKLVCGGVLISSQWVLTAAHCVCYNQMTIPFPNDMIVIQLGKYYRNETQDDSDVQMKTAAAIYVHDNYNEETNAADIALVLLDSPVTFTEWVIPACLPNAKVQWPSPDNQPGIVTGWGLKENFNGSTVYLTESDELRRGLMKWEKPEFCEKQLQKSKKVLSDMYCAVEENLGGVSCVGDSGGAMVFAGEIDGSRRYVAEGLVGWGNESCKSFSSVFVRIRVYMSWIASYASIPAD